MTTLAEFVADYDRHRARDHGRVDAWWDRRTADDWCFQRHDPRRKTACDGCVAAVAAVRRGETQEELPL